MNAPTADIPTIRRSYPVAGMTCAACVHHVGEALRAVPGVTGASVNLATASAAVEHPAGAVDADTLAQAVAAAGYRLDTTAPDAGAGANASASDGINDARRREERALRTRLLLASAGAVILLLGSFPALPWTDGLLTLWWYPLLLGAIATPVQLWAGWPFYTAGVAGLRRGQPNMHTLIALGTTVAYGYSAAAVVARLLDNTGWLSGGLHFDMAAIIIALILLGRWLEARALSRTSDAIVRLMDLRPRLAHLIDGDAATANARDVSIEQVAVGDTLLVRPGEQVPVDGVVQSGASAVDESSLTGESMPVDKAAGAVVYAGALNGTGAFTMTATRVGDDTALAQVIRLVEAAQGSAAPVQRLADRVAARFVPAVGLIALAAAATWLLLGPDPAPQYAMLTLVAVFIIACPCALGLATPTAIIVGVGRGAARGILMRNAAALERAHSVDTVAVDKTGTLTHGQPAVVAVVTADGIADDAVIRSAMALEQFSEHPVGRAVMRYGQQQGLTPPPAADFAAQQGAGVTGRIDGRPVVVGNANLLAQRGIAIDADRGADLGAAAGRMAAQGQTPLFVAYAGQLDGRQDGQPGGQTLGVIAVADTVRPNAPGAVAALRQQGVRVVMLTGDRPEVAAAVAAACGVDEYRAGLLPADKAAAVSELRAAGRTVAMVGDGVNDAPALATADVGIAMGGGADAARESADIALMRDDLHAVATALRLSRATMRTVRQNLFWAFFYNALLIPVAAGALYPVFAALGGVPPGLAFFFGDAGFLNPILAALAMAFSSVSVVSNSLRLRGARI